MEYKGPDKRKYIRVKEALAVSYRPIDSRKKAIRTTIKNISGGGIKLALKQRIKAGTLLEIDLQFFKEKKRQLFRAKVVWVQPNSRGSKVFPYEAGIELLHLNFAARTMLSNYFQYQNRKQLLGEASS